ncbi:MAG: hypothetical protein U9N10_01290 [Bacillota bacterium]|nr:hypothetical protein [Bacillota bacterium]
MRFDKNRMKQIIIVLIFISLVVVQINNFKYGYYRTRDLLEDRRVTWYEIPMTLRSYIDDGYREFVENKYLLSLMLNIGQNINHSNSDTMVSGKFGVDDNERILWKYYDGLLEKIRNISTSNKEKNTEENEILIEDLDYLLIEIIEVYEEIDMEIRYSNSRNFLEFDPFKVDTKYINDLYVEKLKNRGLIE